MIPALALLEIVTRINLYFLFMLSTVSELRYETILRSDKKESVIGSYWN